MGTFTNADAPFAAAAAANLATLPKTKTRGDHCTAVVLFDPDAHLSMLMGHGATQDSIQLQNRSFAGVTASS